MTENNIPTSEVLHRAADLIQEHGWGRGSDSMFAKDGLCFMGGIHGATFGCFRDDYLAAAECPAGRAVYRYLNLVVGDPDAGWEWNDASRLDVNTRSVEPIRTASEVIEVLRAAAAIEQARESDVAPLATTQREVSA